MKILFIGDASNLHNSLACALRSMGHTCIVASDGSTWQKTDRDIDITRHAGRLGTLQYALRLAHVLPKMRGFDIVHIISPHFLTLRPPKLAKVLDYLKRHNRYVFYSASCTDYDYLQTCHDGKTFRYSDFMLGDKPSPYVQSQEWVQHNHWDRADVVDYHKYFIERVDGVVACLYEYYVSYKNKIPHKLAYGGIPIDTRALKPNFLSKAPEKVRFFIGIQKSKNILKGTDRLLDAVKRVRERYPDLCEIVTAENVPFKEYTEMMNSSHVILDQLYSYTPATNALVAMAQGLIAVSGAEQEYYNFIGEQNNQPIINVTPLVEDDIYKKLEWLVLNKNYIPHLSRMSREFVEKHNDSRIVAKRHLDFWNKYLRS